MMVNQVAFIPKPLLRQYETERPALELALVSVLSSIIEESF